MSLTDLQDLTPEQLALLQSRLQRMKKRPEDAGGDGGAGPPLVPRPRDGRAFPLSSPQQLLWFLDRLQPGSSAHTVPLVARLRGELVDEALTGALTGLVERHEILRTTFAIEGSEAVQRIGEPGPVELPRLEVGATSPDAALDEGRRLAAEHLERPFDLERGPLLRPLLVRLGPDDHLLVIALHHIVADAWSAGRLLGELAERYRGAVEGDAPRLPELPIQYADFAVWQREMLDGPTGQALVAWWRERLDGVPPLLDLPVDRPRSGAPSPGVGAVAVSLEPELTERLRAFGRRRQGTLFMVLMAAWKALLGRFSGLDDLFVGTPVSNRDRGALQELVGSFGNLLVLRTDLAGDPDFAELVDRVRATTLGAFEHQELPFERLVRELALERRPGVLPLVQAVLNLQGAAAGAVPELPGVEISLVDAEIGTVHELDLMLVEREGGGLDGTLRHDLGRFEPATAELLAQSWLELLETIAERPRMRVSEIELPAPLAAIRERHRERSRPSRRAGRPLAIAATFTADLLAEGLELWIDALELPFEPAFAPYGQLFQELLDPSSLLGSNDRGANLLLVRLEDWARGGEEAAARSIDELAEALDGLAGRTGAVTLVAVCPPSPAGVEAVGGEGAMERLEERLAAACGAVDGVHVLGAPEVLAAYPPPDGVEVLDPHADRVGHVPYTRDGFALLASGLVRRLARITGALGGPVKAVALDCDDTLWRGVVGEDGVHGVAVDDGARAVQERMLELQRSGVLLCLLSKNRESDVFEVFDRHPGMALGREHLAAWRVDWAPKSSNLRSLAADLDVGVDSFLVLDDSAVECAELRAHCPEALVLRLPGEPDRVASFVDHLWPLDRGTVTTEDRRRTELYRQGFERRRLEREAPSFRSFLEGLNLRVDLSPLDPAVDTDLERVAQLTLRTNQFNSTVKRRSVAELGRLLDPRTGSLSGLVVRLADRFGDYGLVGVVLHSREPSDGTVEVDSLLLSCRALGRGVEHRMVAAVGERARALGAETVRLPYVAAPRSQPVREFLEGLGGRVARDAGGSRDFVVELPADRAAGLVFEPPEVSSEAPERREEEESPRAAAPSERVEEVARYLATSRQVLDALAERRRQAPRSGAARPPFRPPRTDTERRLAELWRELLGVDEVGVDDSFFALGGHSLLGTILMSRVRDLFAVELPLGLLFEEPTLGEVARRVSLAEIAAADAVPADSGAPAGDDLLAALDELDGLSDDEVAALLAAEEGVS